MRAVIAAVIFLLPCHAGAQTIAIPCDQLEPFRQKLAGDYREHPHEGGVTNRGGRIEILISPDGATWSILMTMNGLTCLVASGSDWSEIDVPVSKLPGNPL